MNSHIAIFSGLMFFCSVVAAEDAKVAVEIKDMKKQTMLGVKASVKRAEIGPALAKILPKVGAYLKKNDIKQLSAPMARYKTTDGENFELEGGVIVPEGSKGEGDVVAIELPAGKTAFTVHKGPYDALHNTYMSIMEILKTKSLKAGEISWEIYISDPGNTKPEEIKTEIYIPVGEAK